MWGEGVSEINFVQNHAVFFPGELCLYGRRYVFQVTQTDQAARAKVYVRTAKMHVRTYVLNNIFQKFSNLSCLLN